MTDKIAVFISHISEEAPLAHSLKSWIEDIFVAKRTNSSFATITRPPSLIGVSRDATIESRYGKAAKTKR